MVKTFVWCAGDAPPTACVCGGDYYCLPIACQLHAIYLYLARPHAVIATPVPPRATYSIMDGTLLLDQLLSVFAPERRDDATMIIGGGDDGDTDASVAALYNKLSHDTRRVTAATVSTRREERCRLAHDVLPRIPPGITQHSDEWHAARAELITASDFAQALGKGKFGTQRDLVRRKVRGVAKPIDMTAEPLRWGTRYEPVALAIYTAKTGARVNEYGLLKHPRHAFFGASPDGITEDGIMVEIKCPWKRVSDHSTVPEQYFYQIQGQLDVCDLEECDYIECKFREHNDTTTWLAARAERLPHHWGATREITTPDTNGGQQHTATDQHHYFIHDTDDSVLRAVTAWREAGERVRLWECIDVWLTRVPRNREFFRGAITRLEHIWSAIERFKGDPHAFEEYNARRSANDLDPDTGYWPWPSTSSVAAMSGGDADMPPTDVVATGRWLGAPDAS